MRLIRRLLIIFLAFFGLLAIAANTIASSKIIAPATKFKFSQLAQGNVFTIDIDENTKHVTIDEEGDTLVGAVVRVTPKQPLVGGDPKMEVGTFIYSLIAVCGHNGLVLVQSNLFDPSGKEVQVITEMEAVAVRSQNTPTAVVYNHLCKGYTGTGGNKVKWV